MRVAAALLAVSITLTGCAGFTIGPADSNATVHTSPEKDDDSDLVLPLVLGATALIAVVALAVRADDDSDRADKVRTGHAIAATDVPVRFAGTPDPDHIQRMFVQGHALARAGRCDGVHAIGRNLLKLSYADGVRYTRDPELAACYTPFAMPPAT